MLKQIADNRNPHSIAARLRKDRLSFFWKYIMNLDQPITVLDVGGSEEFWNPLKSYLKEEIYITVVNIQNQVLSNSKITSIKGDALDLCFTDSSFDVVFSNSVIEHLGTSKNQRKMAEEVIRVGRRYFVQTPNRHFFIEPHFLIPFFQYYPLSIKLWLIMHFSLGWFERVYSIKDAYDLMDNINLLDKNDLLDFFPGCHVYEEKIFGMTKSYIAYSDWDI